MGMPLRIRHGKVGRRRGTSDDWPWLEIEKGRLRTVEYDEERGVLEGHNAEGRRHHRFLDAKQSHEQRQT
jgi:hypothetical protein